MNSIKISLLLLLFAGKVSAQIPTDNPNLSTVLLPNGWKLSPAGKSIPLGDLPLNMQLSNSKKLLAVTNNGQSTQTIQLIDPKNEKLLDEKVIGKSWYGLKFSADEKHLFASGGNDNIILDYPVAQQKLRNPDTIVLGKRWPVNKICPAGIEVDDKSGKLYVVTKEDNSLYVIDLRTKKTLVKTALDHEAYSCLLSADKKMLYITLWGGDAVAVYNTSTQKITTTIPTESHPNEIIRSKNSLYLFVANANDNSVSVINTRTDKVIETISTALYPNALTGSTTNGLALSADEKTLYIANADNNCLAIFDVSVPGKSFSKGFIPTGWYPTNVKTVGKKILVANGKGFSSLPNPNGPKPIVKADDSEYQKGSAATRGSEYIGGLFKGTLSFIATPTEVQLKKYSRQVYANTPYTKKVEKEALGEAGNPIPRQAGQTSPIKHVFYIIKENRTYDQILGDVAAGNGDTSLCIFPEKVTPNHHALAREFVLLDNFYVDAEVSADGHNWSTAAYATDFVEKTWPTSYGGRGGGYDFEGTRPAAFPKKGFIWDYCQRAGITYRSYGEFAENGKANIKALQNHICPASPGFDLSIPDVERERIWAHDFDSLLQKNAVPQFSSIRLGNDHTSGQRKGAISVISALADNDLALGELVEHIAESPIWKESVIFVLEDDAQNGSDHVDAHRSPAFVISPYIKKGSVNHTMYSTSGILRTIELILDLPPMSQYDAAAVPLFNCFSATLNLSPYQAKAAQVDLNKRNLASNKSAERSATFNLAKEDAVPDLELNEVVWKAVKGENTVMPPPRHSAFVILEKKKKDDD
ncbi:MAG: bifunctional YncE family protein/alkaline phosphatase family protein [Janthinobacterium lividum]